MSIQSMTVNGMTWHHSEALEESDLMNLQQQYKFHQLDVEDCLSDNERPKIEEYPDYLFFIIHLPVKIGQKVVKEEINIFIGEHHVITFAEGKSGAIPQLWKELEQNKEMRDHFFGKGIGTFLYEILDLLFDRGFPLLDGLTKDLRNIEVELFEKEEGRVNILRDILTLKRNIITMRSILFPQRAMVAQLQHKHHDLIPEELALYFGDLSDAIERQWALLDTAKELSDALQETHESWLGHRTNEIVRVLTIFSVTMVPLTFLTSLYGMNIQLPFQDHPDAFYYMAGGMVALMSCLLGYFAWRKWL